MAECTRLDDKVHGGDRDARSVSPWNSSIVRGETSAARSFGDQKRPAWPYTTSCSVSARQRKPFDSPHSRNVLFGEPSPRRRTSQRQRNDSAGRHSWTARRTASGGAGINVSWRSWKSNSGRKSLRSIVVSFPPF